MSVRGRHARAHRRGAAAADRNAGIAAGRRTERPGTADRQAAVLDKGALKWSVPHGDTPDALDGRQYIIVAASGGNYSGEYLAFALPANGIRTPSQ
jgi:hypothetical protein